MPARISVAMATYNGEKHLKEQLDSLTNQTVPPLELVVCDDRSTDSTVQILRKFALSAPFSVNIHVNNSRLGFSDNFLKAAELCQGDWIAFCDQDDVWLQNKFERVSQTIDKYASNELVLIGHTSLMANENLKQNGQRLPNYSTDSYSKRASNFGFFCIVGFSMVFKASLTKNFDSTLRPKKHRQQDWTPPGHDQWIGMLANAVGDVAYISEPLAIWRRHSTALTTPPKPTTLVNEAKIASSALSPDPYKLLGNMASESAQSFRGLSNGPHNKKIKNCLDVAALGFERLAHNLFTRAELYDANTFTKKLLALAQLVKTNAYFGPKFFSLGLRSFLKDAAFTTGVIGK